jgi:hypothetical protein
MSASWGFQGSSSLFPSTSLFFPRNRDADCDVQFQDSDGATFAGRVASMGVKTSGYMAVASLLAFPVLSGEQSRAAAFSMEVLSFLVHPPEEASLVPCTVAQALIPSFLQWVLLAQPFSPHSS